jgi:hypothetical protein
MRIGLVGYGCADTPTAKAADTIAKIRRCNLQFIIASGKRFPWIGTIPFCSAATGE